MNYLLLFAFFIGIISGCGSSFNENETKVLNIKSESDIKIINDKTVLKEFFIVINPPSKIDKLKVIIDKVIENYIKNIKNNKYEFNLQFYKKTKNIDENFKPYHDKSCITGCDDGLHIWEVAYEDKLATIFINRDSCQLHFYYIFDNRKWLSDQEKIKFSSKKIINEDECMKTYGYIPLPKNI